MDRGATTTDGDGLASLTTSARGWHGVQLAVLAFIGLCGVLSDADPGVPDGLRAVAGGLALGALGLACLATFVVARVAWPLSTGERGPGDLASSGRRLRLGVALTFVAVAAMALAASVGWWPVDDGGGDGSEATGAEVRVTVRGGGTACGRLVDAPAGILRLVTDDGTAEVAIGRLTTIAAADGC